MISLSVFLVVLAAVIMDRRLGEPSRFHPLVGFGNWAKWLEQNFYRHSLLAGLLTTALTLTIPMLVCVFVDALIQQSGLWVEAIFSCVVLYLCIGGKSLEEHAQAIAQPLKDGNLTQARQALSYIVSRDTSQLDEQQISSATVESVLENGADAVFSALFWFLLAGVPGVVLYRMSNTLDAMWGYKNDRYILFGRVAARLDDVMNFIPARLTALSYALVAGFSLKGFQTQRFKQAIKAWREQGGGWKSPNAGPVMASGAGALGIVLGGAAVYHGQAQQRPVLGYGHPADADSIFRSLALLKRVLTLWLLVLLFVATITFVYTAIF